MEKLILTCGRYVSPSAGDSEARLRAMEVYLACLTEELELLVEEVDKALDAMEKLIAERDGLSATAAVSDGLSEAITDGEGGV